MSSDSLVIDVPPPLDVQIDLLNEDVQQMRERHGSTHLLAFKAEQVGERNSNDISVLQNSSNTLEQLVEHLSNRVSRLESAMGQEQQFSHDLFSDNKKFQCDFNTLEQLVEHLSKQVEQLQTQLLAVQSSHITHDEVRFIVEDLMVEYELIDEIDEDPLKH